MVHPAAIDLDLLLVKLVDKVPRLLVGGHELGDVEWLISQARADQVRVGLRQAFVGLAGREVHLGGGGVSGAADAVGPWKGAVEIVEAVVFVVDHDQVIYACERADVAFIARAVAGSDLGCREDRARGHDRERADREGQDTSQRSSQSHPLHEPRLFRTMPAEYRPRPTKGK